MNLMPILLSDFYKLSHIAQAPESQTSNHSTWTCRMSRIPGINHTIAFGMRGLMQEWFIKYFNKHFFNANLDDILEQFRRVNAGGLGILCPDDSHIIALHDLGYLPIEVCALPEGTRVPIRVPTFTMRNTHPNFAWIVGALEDLVSCETWSAMTVATIAGEFRRILDQYAIETTGSTEGVDFQAHDFSMRGMNGIHHSMKANSGHLLSFLGTDAIPSLFYLEWHYDGCMDNLGIGGSIPATEHSVECAHMPDDHDEYAQTKRLLTEIYPVGLFSRVCDTFDFWNFVTTTVPSLKKEIMARDGKFVIRPDSGDPVDIICGTSPHAFPTDTKWLNYTNQDDLSDVAEIKGLIEVLWDIFGGTTNDLGYKVLDPHVGAIYGDSITLERAELICKKLKDKGFASTNIVLGIGSYSYAYNTRDTFGMAFKSTYITLRGENGEVIEKMISKDPKTDDGVKKSAKGLVAVVMGKSGELELVDNLLQLEKQFLVEEDLLRPIFKNGRMVTKDTLAEIRERMERG